MATIWLRRVNMPWPLTAWTPPRSRCAAIGGEPIATLDTDQLDLHGGQPWAPGVPGGRFAIAAAGRLQAPAGDYLLDVTSDDGIRLWLDDKLIHEDWTHHAPRTEQLPVKLDGEQTRRLKYFQIDGYAALRVELKRP